MKEFPGRCWIVWMMGDVSSYRCFNVETAQEAADEWVRRYGPNGSYDVLASLSRDDGRTGPYRDLQRFHVEQRIKRVA